MSEVEVHAYHCSMYVHIRCISAHVLHVYGSTFQDNPFSIMVGSHFFGFKLFILLKTSPWTMVSIITYKNITSVSIDHLHYSFLVYIVVFG